MIQDIEPVRLDNQYRNVAPDDGDMVFFFEGSSLLGRLDEDIINVPSYREFLDGYNGSDADNHGDRDFDFIYLFALVMPDRTENRFFLAKPVISESNIAKGSFQGEMADSAVHIEYESCWEGYEFTGVNLFRKARPKEIAYASITAFHLYGWYRDNTFCGRCGHTLLHGKKERMMFCPVCKNSIYPKICPAVIVAVTCGNKILLTKYVGRTYKDYALVAGFTEIGETVEETVHREVFEETGLKVKNLRYYKSQPWGLSGSLLYGYFCEVDGDTGITLQEDELAIGKWVSASEIDMIDDGISLTKEMIVKFAREHSE